MSSEKVNLRQLTEIERAALLACIDGIIQAMSKQTIMEMDKVIVDGVNLMEEIQKLSKLLSKNTVMVMEGVPPHKAKQMKVKEVSAEKFQALIGELPDDNPLEGL